MSVITTFIALGSATLIAAGDARPTGSWAADVLIVAVATALVVGAASTAPTWALVTAAILAGVAGWSPWSVLAASAAIAVAWWARRFAGVAAPLQATSAALTLSACSLSAISRPFGLSAAVAVCCALLVTLAGVRTWPKQWRRRFRRAVGSLVLLAAGATTALAVAGLSAKDPLVEGRDRAEAGLAAVRAGDYDRAAELFDEAADRFANANRRLDRPWTQPAALVPIVAQHRRMATELSAEGASASRVAADALDRVDFEALSVRDGSIDVDKVEDLSTPLAELDAALESLSEVVAEQSSPWLVRPAASALDGLRADLTDADVVLGEATSALAVAPRLLGAEGAQTYLIVFTTPAEARPLGFPGNFAELRVDEGHVELGDFGRITDLENAAQMKGVYVTAPDRFMRRYGRFIANADDMAWMGTWRNLTMSPDFPTVAATMSELYRRTTGTPVDAVLLADPQFLAILIGYTGPVELPSVNLTLDESTAAEYLLIGQYAESESANEERLDALGEAAEAVMDKLLDGALPDPAELARDLGPLVESQRLMMWSHDEQVAALLEQVGLGAAMPTADGGDGFFVTYSNASGNKIDYFLDRSLSYRAVTDARGTTDSTATITLTNTAPTSGFADYVIGNMIGMPPGTDHLWLSFYSPLKLGQATVDGEASIMEVGVEGDWNVYSTYVTIASGDSLTIELELTGEVERRDGVVTWEQPLVRPATTDISSAPASR